VHLSFHALTVAAREVVAEDARCLTLAIPPALRAEYQFQPGQHVALRTTIDGRDVRRTYSIVSGAGDTDLRIGVRIQPRGGLSHFLAHEVKIGDRIEALSPTGRFLHAPTPADARSYVAFAAGSGITPVLAIVRAVLEHEPRSRFTLVYGNRTTARTMFLEELLALKNRYLGRFALHFVMSREPQDVELFNGRIDAAKVRELAEALFDPAQVDEVFVCGPGDMVAATREALRALGTTAPIHFERFAAGIAAAPAPVAAAAAGARADGEGTLVTVIQDGRRRSFEMLSGDASVLDAAGRAGLDLPFSCRAGVCSTCRAKVVSGAVTMAHNVALEDWELAAGFVLCCQARPTSRELELSYDEK
jgi:ring-1,2-phenylacetyl-CoA epoxidase subunit PaaE